MSDSRSERREEFRRRCESIDGRASSSHIWTGLFILLIGVAALVKVSNPDLPAWLFSWKTFLIALGLFIGIKHRFKGPAWFILILVGGAFLFTDLYPDISIRRYIWPIALIAVGSFLIFSPKKRHVWRMQYGQKKKS